jgi:hypothetical protein
MKRFPWGKKIETFIYNFDGQEMEVIKYHPWQAEGCTVLIGKHNDDQILYHCPALNESQLTLHGLLISWIAYQRLGANQPALVHGICRALNVDDAV